MYKNKDDEFNEKDGCIGLDKLRTIDKIRLIKNRGKCIKRLLMSFISFKYYYIIINMPGL